MSSFKNVVNLCSDDDDDDEVVVDNDCTQPYNVVGGDNHDTQPHDKDCTKPCDVVGADNHDTQEYDNDCTQPYNVGGGDNHDSQLTLPYESNAHVRSSPPLKSRLMSSDSLATVVYEPKQNGKVNEESSYWTCPVCDYSRNKASDSECLLCNSHRNTNGRKECVERNKEKDMWKCLVCECENSQRDEKCSYCGRASASLKMWTCGVCTLENHPLDEKCAACDTPRPSAVSPPAPTQSSLAKNRSFATTSSIVTVPNDIRTNVRDRCRKLDYHDEDDDVLGADTYNVLANLNVAASGVAGALPSVVNGSSKKRRKRTREEIEEEKSRKEAAIKFRMEQRQAAKRAKETEKLNAVKENHVAMVREEHRKRAYARQLRERREQNSLRTAQNQAKFANREIQVHFDALLKTSECGQRLDEQMKIEKIAHVWRDLTVQNSIEWERLKYDPVVDEATGYMTGEDIPHASGLNFVLVFVNTDDLVALNDDSLFISYARHVCGSHPTKHVELVMVGQEYRKYITAEAFDALMVKLFMMFSGRCTYRLMATDIEAATYLTNVTLSMAKAPYRVKDRISAATIDTTAISAFQPDKTASNLGDTWKAILKQLPGMSLAKAKLVTSKYQTISSLVSSYKRKCRSEEDEELLLQNLHQDIPNARRLGPKLSQRVCTLVRRHCPDQCTDDIL